LQKSMVCIMALIGASGALAQTATEFHRSIQEGQLLQSQGRLIEAEGLFQNLERNHLWIGTAPDIQSDVLSSLASVEADLDHLENAVRVYQQAIRVLAHTSNTDRVIAVQIRIAELYLDANQTATAEKLLRHVMRRADTSRSGEAYILDVLAGLYASHKKWPAAEGAERESLKILDSLNAPEPAAIATSTLHLSAFLNIAGRPADAWAYGRRALNLLVALPLPQPALQASAEINLASILSRLGHPAEAEAECEMALKRAAQYYGPDNPQTARMMLAQAAVFRVLGSTAKAQHAQTQGEQILNITGGPRLDAIAAGALLSK
jgi:tetratricopeptide (TPR) repeat protein